MDNKIIQKEIEEQLKTDYRLGNFLPENYKSEKIDPMVVRNLAEAKKQDQEMEELEQRIIEFRNRLGL